MKFNTNVLRISKIENGIRIPSVLFWQGLVSEQSADMELLSYSIFEIKWAVAVLQIY